MGVNQDAARLVDVQGTAFTSIDEQRIHLGIYGIPETEKEYCRAVAEWNFGIIAPKARTADV